MGFLSRRSEGITRFLDGPEAKLRDFVHVVFTGKKVRDEYSEPVPGIEEFEWIEEARTLPFERLTLDETDFIPKKGPSTPT